MGKRRVGAFLVLAIAALSLSGCQGWFAQYSTTDHSSLTSISCPDASTCFVVGGVSSSGPSIIKRSTDSGQDWIDLSSTAPKGTLTDISCVDADDCVVAGQGVFSTSDGGSTWTTLVPPTNDAAATALYCADLMHCWVSWNNSQVSITTDGGATWSSSQLSTSVSGAETPILTSITCLTDSECIGVGAQSLWVSDPGYPPVPEIFGLLAWSTEGGTTWQAETLPDSDGGVSCLTPTACIDSSGPQMLVTADDGATWTASDIAVPGGPYFGSAITCPDAQHCMAAGYGFVLATADDGTTWNVQPTNPSDVDLNAISCASVASCWAAGSTTNDSSYGSIVLHTLTGGTAWPSISSITPDQGPVSGGTQVTIIGAGFFGTPSVIFGSGPSSTPATSVTVVSPTELQATSPTCSCLPPPGGLAVPVTVTEFGLGSSPVNLNYPFTYVSSS